MVVLPPECRAFREALVRGGRLAAVPEDARGHAEVCRDCRALAGVVGELVPAGVGPVLVTPRLRRRVLGAAARDRGRPLPVSALVLLALLNLVVATAPVVAAVRWLSTVLGSPLPAVAAVLFVLAPLTMAAAGAAAASGRMVPALRRRLGGVA